VEAVTSNDELQQLIRFLIRSKDGFAIGFARGLSPAERKPLLDQISVVLAKEGTELRIADYLGRPILNLYQQLEADGFFAEPHKPTVVLGLESSIFADEGNRFLLVLNLDRDRFRRTFNAPLLFWLSTAAAVKLQSKAHDFYDYWTGVFDFEEQASEVGLMNDERSSAEAGQASEDEKRYLRDEISRHRQILSGLLPPSESPLEKGVRGISFDTERNRLRAIDSLRIIARDLGRLGKIDEAKTYVDQSLKLMPPLNESAPQNPSAIQAWADFGEWLNDQLTHRNAALAMALMEEHQALLNAAARGALDLKMYEAALLLLQPLNRFLNARGMRKEADEWSTQVLHTLKFPVPDPDVKMIDLWLYMAIAQAERMLHSGELDNAEKHYLDIQKVLESLKVGVPEQYIAVVYHQLGIVSQERGNHDQAEAWYKKALAIFEQLNDRVHLQSVYHQLSRVTEERGDLDSAEKWCQKSREINETLDNRAGMASNYHQLGNIAYLQGALDRAEELYIKALEISTTLGNRLGMAATYGQLGLLAEKMGRMQEALARLVRCVGLFDEFPSPSLGPIPISLARLTHSLGMEALESSWLSCHGVPLPETVRRGVEEPVGNPK
jgi:tetratricopeptide (TPR) repeat protein